MNSLFCPFAQQMGKVQLKTNAKKWVKRFLMRQKEMVERTAKQDVKRCKDFMKHSVVLIRSMQNAWSMLGTE